MAGRKRRKGNPAAPTKKSKPALLNRYSPRDTYALAVGFLGTVVGLPLFAKLNVVGTFSVAVVELILLMGLYWRLPKLGGTWRKVVVSLLGLILALGVLPVVGYTIFPAPQDYETVSYSPFTEAQELKSTLTVKAEYEDGECYDSSHNNLWRVDAYRCIANRGLFDPCFVRSQTQQMVCPGDPWSSEVYVLDQPSVNPEPFRPQPVEPNEMLPWAIELTTGERCIFRGGQSTMNADQRVNYDCDRQRIAYEVDFGQGTARVEGPDVGITDVLLQRIWF